MKSYLIKIGNLLFDDILDGLDEIIMNNQPERDDMHYYDEESETWSTDNIFDTGQPEDIWRAPDYPWSTT